MPSMSIAEQSGRLEDQPPSEGSRLVNEAFRVYCSINYRSERSGSRGNTDGDLIGKF
jgi:hypothetical protein